ncbi:MAG: hypothetical protein ACKO2L_11175 [Planctomycetaceae bacterium]
MKTLGSRHTVVCRLNDAAQEKFNPAFPVTVRPDSAQSFIVLMLMTFEAEADIQTR